jgi:hypothetical protein
MSLVRLSFELGMAVSDYNCGITNDHSAIIRATFMYLDKVRVTSLDEDELVECYAIIGQMWAAVIERSEDIVSSEPEAKVEPKVESKAPVAKVEPKAPVAKDEPKAPEPKVEPKAPVAKVEPKVESKASEPKAEPKAPEPKAPVAKAPEAKAPVTHSI